MKHFFILSLIVLLSACGLSNSEPEIIGENFMRGIMNGEVSKAYGVLFKHKESSVSREENKRFITGTFNFLRKNGRPEKHIEIENKLYGGDIKKIQYLLKQTKGHSIWTFYFIKRDLKWKLYDVKFTDQIALVL